MEDDEETLSTVNKPCKLVTEKEILEIDEIKSAEQCLSFHQFGVSSLNVGGDEAEEVEEEEKPVAHDGGEEPDVENYVSADTVKEFEVAAGESSVSEIIETQMVVVEEAVAEETQVLGSEGGVVTCGDEMTTVDRGDMQLETKDEEESTLVFGTDLEVVICGDNFVADTGDEVPEMREGNVELDTKAESEMEEEIGEGQMVEVGVEEVEGVDTQAIDSDSETVMKTADGGDENIEKVVMVNDSEIGTAEEPGAIEERKVETFISKEITLGEAKNEVEITTEGNLDLANSNVREQVRKLGRGGMENTGSEVNDELVEDKGVAAEESSMPATKMVAEKNFSMVVSKDPKSDESVNVAENSEEVVVEKELPSGDIKMETEAGMETESDADDPDQEMGDSMAALPDEEDETMVVGEEDRTQDTELETETDVGEPGKLSGGKLKRGKKLKSTSVSKATAKAPSRKTVGEDVCFICFDGGDLVLCDRRGCPKAYHPSCVNRDESFFEAKGLWNCGWHLCSICQKNARFMCYTCTFSLCKSCTKDAVILRVRGNKGFCETCMKTVMLIENNEQGNKDAQIDFDDRSSWEYLFKDYYIDLKSKLVFSSAEVAEAKNPWKGTDVLSGTSKQESSEAQVDANDGGSGSDDSIENNKTIKLKRRRVRKKSKFLTKEEQSVSAGVVAGYEAISLSDNTEWVSKELLEFVSHMKNGDTSVLSQFDVQALLLEYIKRNKLRDPRRKSQIICDARLVNIFGKPRVGHFEMLKLLESHFLVKDYQVDDVQGSVVDTENSQLEVDGNGNTLTKGVKDKKRKTHRKGGSQGRQSNLDDYAAVDMHNIGLIYLRRKLMEDLLEDDEKFHDKVVGTFVRIRISGSVKNQDLYRLVQVVGTRKTADIYKIGKKTTDAMVEILNLDKTEVISIDTVSNQEFTEEECNRLRQSIKCGLISRLTVGEILDKAMDIQEARVNDWMESEILRLSHLRDRASDLGRRKELRECVEKLQLLKTPEERWRRLDEIPEIHADPKMDPSYESDENDSETEESRRDAFMRSRSSGFSRRGRVPISPGSYNSMKDSWSGAGKVSSKIWELNRNLSSNFFSTNATHGGENEIVNENSWNQEKDKDAQESTKLENLNSTSNSESVEWCKSTVTQSESFTGVPSVTSQTSFPAMVAETAVKINETEKMWHYQDPSGKGQGPFSVVQLRKWNNTGYFPAGLRIWKTTENQDDSILLVDALAGKVQNKLPAVDNRLPETNALRSPPILSGHSSKTGTSLHQDQRPNIDQNPGSHSKLQLENLSGNDIANLPSPTPKQSSTNWTEVEGGLFPSVTQSSSVNGMLPSPIAVLLNTEILPAPASFLNSAVHSSTAFTSPPNSQQDILMVSGDSVQTQTTLSSEPHEMWTHGHLPITLQPVPSVFNHNPQTDTQDWGAGTQSGQTHGYSWGGQNVQNSAASISNSGTTAMPQPDFWRPTHGSQPNMHLPAMPKTPWGMGPTDSIMSLGLKPENPNIGWVGAQVNPNIGSGIPAPGNTNMNWGPAMQAPPPVHATSGWVASPGNAGASIQGPAASGNVNSAWVATSAGWGPPPVQVPVPGNGWWPVSGIAGAPVQGNTKQELCAWGGEQNNNAGQFSGQQGGGQDRDSGFGGGMPWNRQSSFGGGGPGGSRPFNRREVVCPYNANGRCKKGASCDYLHA